MKEQNQSYYIRYAAALEKRFVSGILQELQEYPHFVTWLKTAQEKKLPINPQTGTLASSINPNTWGTLEQSLAIS